MKHLMLYVWVSTILINIATFLAVFSGAMKAGAAFLPVLAFALIGSVAWSLAFDKRDWG